MKTVTKLKFSLSNVSILRIKKNNTSIQMNTVSTLKLNTLNWINSQEEL